MRAAAVGLFAGVGALLFAASLAYFVYAFMFEFNEGSSVSDLPTAITWNVALFTIFALHHSVFARTGARAWVARVSSPQLERAVYVWIASTLFFLVCIAWRPIPGTAWAPVGAIRWALWFVQLTGIWLILRSAVALDVFELAGVRQAVVKHEDVPSQQFKTSGPYGWVRHPIYAGWFLFVLAACPMTFTRLTFALVSGAYLLIGIPLEERSMERTSGDGYARYAAAVRWKLIPGIF